MPKLHEILAVETSLAETSNRISKEVAKTFESKPQLFTGVVKSNTIFDENLQHLRAADEVKEVEDTVPGQLAFLSKHLADYWDVTLQKEAANQTAKADIVVDGVTIATNVPAIVLLSLEKKLSALLHVYNQIPTLDTAKAWEIDPNYAKPFVYRTKHIAERQQTQTTKEWIEVSPATKEHKAQVAQQDFVKVIGKYSITDYSGMTTAHDKATKLQRLSDLIRAVKAARQRANEAEINPSLKIGKALLDFINN